MHNLGAAFLYTYLCLGEYNTVIYLALVRIRLTLGTNLILGTNLKSLGTNLSSHLSSP